MLKCCQRVRTLIYSTRRVVNAFSSYKTHTLPSSALSNLSLSRPIALQHIFTPHYTKQIASIRQSSQFNVGNEEFDIDSLFSDDVEPSFYDEEGFEGNKRNNYEESGFGSSLNELKYEDSDLSSFPKNFYQVNPISAKRTESEINSFFDKHSIKVSGLNSPKPMLSFEETNFPDYILERLTRNGFDKPTPIQSITWPVTLSGRNVIGIAQTGSGKTLSFLLPAVTHIQAQAKPQRGEGPVALVLCPTRELAKQCETVAKQYFQGQIRTTCLFGGGERARQLEDIAYGCDLAIATPGRLMDLMESREVSMHLCTFLVLDEADRMLDMGFEPQIRKIINQIRPDRQVTMWSATWPKEVQQLATRYLMSDEDPVQLKVGSSELTANKDVQQKFTICDSSKKQDTFLSLLKDLNIEFQHQDSSSQKNSHSRRKRHPKILVFCNTKKTCDFVSRGIHRGGMSSESLHGDLTQRMRDNVMRSFHRGYTSVVVATDVAARGLDVKDIDYVINYDAPANCVSYIHRIGRTGRGGQKGLSITLLTEGDGAIVPDLIQTLRDIDHPIDEKLVKMEAWWHKKKSSMKTRSSLMKERKLNSRGYGNQYRNVGYNQQNRRNSYNKEEYLQQSRGNDYNEGGFMRKQRHNSYSEGYRRKNDYRRKNQDFDDEYDDRF